MHGVNRKSQSFGFQQRALEVHPFFKAGNVNELWRPASLRVWASQKSMLERRKYLLTKQSVWQSCWHFPRSSGHHKILTGSNVKMSIRRFYGLYISSSIKAGSLSVFSPPLLHYVWTNSAALRPGAERDLWSAFYWYVHIFGWFYTTHLNAWTLGYSISMIVYGFTLFRCVQSQTLHLV